MYSLTVHLTTELRDARKDIIMSDYAPSGIASILPTRAVCPSSVNSFLPAAASQICTNPLCVPTAT